MTSTQEQNVDSNVIGMEMESNNASTGKRCHLLRMVYDILLGQNHEAWMHMINMLVLCTALMLATAYTGLSWFGNGYVELQQCQLFERWFDNLSFVIQFGLAILIMAMLQALGMSIVGHDNDGKKKDGKIKSDSKNQAWRYYFPLFLLHLVVIIIIFVFVAVRMGRLVDDQKHCQRRLYLLSLGSVSCPECVEYALLTDEEKMIEHENNDTDLWGRGGNHYGVIVWYVMIELSGVWCVFGAILANWKAK